MAEKETRNEPKDLIEATPEEISKTELLSLDELQKEADKKTDKQEERSDAIQSWVPKTRLGREVKSKKITKIDDILKEKRKILEPEIVDSLISVESDLALIGQAKGKFGGGKRRAWRQTQRKTMEGNVVSFSAMMIVGDKQGHIGIGMGKGKETIPAREKALRKAKLNIISIARGCGNFDCSCEEPHSVPLIVEGKCGSVRVKLIPAPQGTGLVVGDNLKKVLRLAGIKDVYGVTRGNTRTTFNTVKACVDALSKTTEVRK